MAWTLTIILENFFIKTYKKAVFLMFQIVHLECHQQRSFTLKMHQNRWRLGLRRKPHWGSLQRSPDALTGLRGLLLRGGGEGRGREERGGEERQIDAPVCACAMFCSVLICLYFSDCTSCTIIIINIIQQCLTCSKYTTADTNWTKWPHSTQYNWKL